MKYIVATTLAVIGAVNAIAIAEPVAEARVIKLKPNKFRLLCGIRGAACPRDAMPLALANALDEAEASDFVPREVSDIEARDAEAEARVIKLKPNKFRLLCGIRGAACPRDAMPEALASALETANVESEELEKRDADPEARVIKLKPNKFRLLCGIRGAACPRSAVPEALQSAIDDAEEAHELITRNAEAEARVIQLKPNKFRLLCGIRGAACPRSEIPEAVTKALEAANQ